MFFNIFNKKLRKDKGLSERQIYANNFFEANKDKIVSIDTNNCFDELIRDLDGKIVFLGCPFFSNSEYVRKSRVEKVNKFTNYLINKGVFVYSPLTYTSRFKFDIYKEDFWVKFNSFLLKNLYVVHFIILGLDGWNTSVGLSLEAHTFLKKSKIWNLYLVDEIFVKIKTM